MMFGVFLTVILSLDLMAVCRMRMMASLFVIPGLVMPGLES